MGTLLLPPPLPLLLLLAPLLLPPAALLGGAGGGAGGWAAEALRVVRLEAPRTAKRGEPLVLRCVFDLGDDPLYTVKWYKDSREFFRFSPQESPPLRVFPTEGIDLDEQASTATEVRLRSVSRASAGKYSCEVTEDAPSFHALIDLAEVHVVEIDLDPDPPKLEGVLVRYRVNDEVNAVCRGPWSRPAAQLKLQLNGQHVNSSSVLRHLPPEERKDGLLRPAVKLRTRVRASQDGRLRLRCTAVIPDVYHKVHEVKALLIPGPPSASEPTAPPGVADDFFPLPTVGEPVLGGANDASPTMGPPPKALILLLLLLVPSTALSGG